MDIRSLQKLPARNKSLSIQPEPLLTFGHDDSLENGGLNIIQEKSDEKSWEMLVIDPKDNHDHAPIMRQNSGNLSESPTIPPNRVNRVQSQSIQLKHEKKAYNSFVVETEPALVQGKFSENPSGYALQSTNLNKDGKGTLVVLRHGSPVQKVRVGRESTIPANDAGDTDGPASISQESIELRQNLHRSFKKSASTLD